MLNSQWPRNKYSARTNNIEQEQYRVCACFESGFLEEHIPVPKNPKWTNLFFVLVVTNQNA